MMEQMMITFQHQVEISDHQLDQEPLPRAIEIPPISWERTCEERRNQSKHLHQIKSRVMIVRVYLPFLLEDGCNAEGM